MLGRHLSPGVDSPKVVKTTQQLSLFARSRPSGFFFSLSESKVGAGWPLAAPGQIQGELDRGRADHRPGRVCANSQNNTNYII